MATITYNFIPAQEVWVITQPEGCDIVGVHKGEVIQVRAKEATNISVLEYDVRLVGQRNTVVFTEDDMFIDKATALVEYDTRLGV